MQISNKYIGGAIGTGLFVGSGSILSETGPAPLFMGYLSMMFVVWVVMNDLAEMVVLLPMKGISNSVLRESFRGTISGFRRRMELLVCLRHASSC